jgi:MFS family permease
MAEAAIPEIGGIGAAAPTESIAVRHVTAAVIGNALECYDFIVYAFFAVQIGRTFFPAHTAFMSLMLSLATFGAGFATRPLGALVLGAYGDRVGRKPAMLLSFALMGLAILGMAATPSYARIGVAAPILMLVARLAQGFALGGEIGTTTTYLVEAAPAGQRGLYGAWQIASQGLASLAAGLVGVGLSNSLGAQDLATWGWRIAFLIGASVLPIGLIIRRNLPETLHRPEAGEVAATPSLATFIRHGRIITLGLLIVMGTTVHFYVMSYMTTYASAVLGMKANLAFAATAVFGAVGVVFSLLGGAASDRIGRWPVMVWPRVVLIAVIYPAFWLMAHYRDGLSLLGGAAVLTALGQFSVGTALVSLTEGLPKAIRCTAVSVLYAVATALFGSTTQPAVTWLIHATGDVLAPAWYLMGATALATAAMAMMKETAPGARNRP